MRLPTPTKRRSAIGWTTAWPTAQYTGKLCKLCTMIHARYTCCALAHNSDRAIETVYIKYQVLDSFSKTMGSPPPRKSSFVIVRIPAVDDETIDSIELSQPEELDANLACLTAHLNDHFRKHGGAVTDDNRAKLIDHMRQHVAQKQQGSGDAASAPPDEAMLAKMATSQTCDIV